MISADALSALINLGYDRSDAAEAVAGAVATIGGGPVEEVIRRALQTLAPEG
ncbi:MAG: RuvA C-terminal domain-containing protein [Pseudomonadota bacterium]